MECTIRDAAMCGRRRSCRLEEGCDPRRSCLDGYQKCDADMKCDKGVEEASLAYVKDFTAHVFSGEVSFGPVNGLGRRCVG